MDRYFWVVWRRSRTSELNPINMKHALRALSCILTVTLFHTFVTVLWVQEEAKHKGTIFTSTGMREAGLSYLQFPKLPTPGEVKFRKLVPISHHLNEAPAGAIKELQQIIDDLLEITTKPSIKCRKLLKQGGHFCKGIADGDKFLCLDKFVKPPKQCYVYSVGTGQDFSFDKAMGKMGCQVYAFDDDYYQSALPRNMGEGVHFLHVRVSSSKIVRYDTTYHTERDIWHHYIYRPLDNIMNLLRQYNATIDFLKIDVDGPEWEMLENSIFQTPILERTMQFALEFHLDYLTNNTNKHIQDYTDVIHNYIRIFKGLQERGLKLAAYEPNFYAPKLAEIADRILPIYAEQLWLNTRRHNSSHRFRPTDDDFDLVES